MPRTDDNLGGSLITSVVMHTALFGGSLLVAWLVKQGILPSWGVENPSGGSVAITSVDRIPVRARSGPPNPVANDTESEAPQKIDKQEKERVEEEPEEAVAIGRTKKKQKPRRPQDPTVARKPFEEPPEPNQLHSAAPQAAASEMFSQTAGGDRVGEGEASPFGFRFGAYAKLLRDRVAQKWNTQDVRGRTSPMVVVKFDLERSGEVRNVSLAQRSGDLTLDNSAIRAVEEAAPFPPIPPGFERPRATVELKFQIKR